MSPALKPKTPEAAMTNAERLAALRAVVESKELPPRGWHGFRRLVLEHALCVLLARAVRVRARDWSGGVELHYGLHWRTVWARWMRVAETDRALARYQSMAMREDRRSTKLRRLRARL
jgi:hypothetical protein